MKTLLLFRHAKSDWSTPGQDDFDRPLNERGKKDAVRMGAWMKENNIRPEWVLCSTAERAQQTLHGLRKNIDIPDTLIQHEERLYMADAAMVLQLLGECPEDMDDVLIIGHNPTMDDVLTHLCGANLPLTKSGKLMATATLAVANLPDDWHQLPAGCGNLSQIIRPGELK